MVCECAGRDEQTFLITCVHFTPKWIEATDGFTFIRYRLKTNVQAPTLVRAKYVKPLGSRGPTKIAETENWLHFKNGSGVRIAVRRFDPAQYNGEKLDRFNDVVKERGSPAPFPKSLISASKLAEVFSREYKDNDFVTVHLQEGFVKVTSQGVSGRTLHKSKVNYHGEPLTFTVGPKILAGMIEKHDHIEVKAGRLLVNAANWYFTTHTNPAGN
jgi:hypothetical protein